MLEIVERIIHGKQCPKCGNERLYRLKDKRFKCNACFYKYSPRPIEKDLKLLNVKDRLNNNHVNILLKPLSSFA